MRKRLGDAEEHQRSVAAQLHSREAQLTLVRQELLAADAERERWPPAPTTASPRLHTSSTLLALDRPAGSTRDCYHCTPSCNRSPPI